MGNVDLKIRFKMEDLANVTQTVFIHAVPQEAGAGTVMHTANVLDAQTLGKLLQVILSMYMVDML